MTKREKTRSDKREAKIEALLALLPPNQRESFAAILGNDDAECHRLLTETIAGGVARLRTLTAGLTASVFLFLFIAYETGLEEVNWPILLTIVGGIYMLMLIALGSPPGRSEAIALEIAIQSDDIGSISPLLEGLKIRKLPPRLRTKTKLALTGMLLRLTEAEANALTITQRKQLCRFLWYIQRDTECELRLAVLKVLEQLRDKSLLGHVYQLATGEASTRTAETVRQAARVSLENMLARIDFGLIERIPEYTERLIRQMQSEGTEVKDVAECMLALRKLLPLLTAENYRSVLTERNRDRLYGLLIMHLQQSDRQYSGDEALLEIVRAAGRIGDTRALPSIKKITVWPATTTAAKRLRSASREIVRLLELQVVKEKESRTLLRGSSAPDPLPAELLRPTIPAISDVAPKELLRAAFPDPIAYRNADSRAGGVIAQHSSNATAESAVQLNRRGGEED